MGFTSGRNIDVAFPGLQYGNRQTCGAPKAKKTNSFAMLNAGDTQAAKSDNAGTQQGSDMDVIQAGGQRKVKSARARAYSAYPPSTVYPVNVG